MIAVTCRGSVTPSDFAELLEVADRRVAGGGAIVILEIFPLLHPERYAVAYESATLQDILIKSGLVADSAPISLRGSGATAYCVAAKRRQADRAVDRAVVQTCVEREWDEIRKRSLSAYSAFMPPTNLGNYQRLFSLLTTITSIESWRAGTWRPAASR